MGNADEVKGRLARESLAGPLDAGERELNYIDACRWAATQQGLDDAVAALVAAKIPHSVEQTGGFVMLITSYVFPAEPDSAWVGVSCEDGYLIMGYDSLEADGTLIASGVAAEDVPNYVQGFRDGVMSRRRAHEDQVRGERSAGA